MSQINLGFMRRNDSVFPDINDISGLNTTTAGPNQSIGVVQPAGNDEIGLYANFTIPPTTRSLRQTRMQFVIKDPGIEDFVSGLIVFFAFFPPASLFPPGTVPPTLYETTNFLTQLISTQFESAIGSVFQTNPGVGGINNAIANISAKNYMFLPGMHYTGSYTKGNTSYAVFDLDSSVHLRLPELFASATEDLIKLKLLVYPFNWNPSTSNITPTFRGIKMIPSSKVVSASAIVTIN